MIVDAQNRFSNAQTVTTGSENGVTSTNVIDLSSARDIGSGQDIYVFVQVTTLLDGAGDTCTVAIITDDNESMTSAVVVQTIGTFAALAAVGTRLVAKLQPSSAYERYIALRYTAAGSGPLTAGAFTAGLTLDVDTLRSYPKGYTIA